MNQFNVQAYNQVHSIEAADARFKQQLEKAGLTRDDLFFQLGPLFHEPGHAGLYAISLLHRHYSLYDGERMVTTGNSTMPSRDTSPNIVVDTWFSTGEEFEHRSEDNTTSLRPPTPDFFTKFKTIMDSNGIDVLGVSYAPTLATDSTIFESAGPRDRERVTKIVPISSLDPIKNPQTAWIIDRDLIGRIWNVKASCSCDSIPPCN